jgi:cytochrome c oxidase subunit 2
VSDGTGRGPSLAGIYGKPEKLRSGETRPVDETLIRQAIVNPNSILLPNYPPIMPTFQGQINEEQVLQLVAYVKSLGAEERQKNSK